MPNADPVHLLWNCQKRCGYWREAWLYIGNTFSVGITDNPLLCILEYAESLRNITSLKYFKWIFQVFFLARLIILCLWSRRVIPFFRNGKRQVNNGIFFESLNLRHVNNNTFYCKWHVWIHFSIDETIILMV